MLFVFIQVVFSSSSVSHFQCISPTLRFPLDLFLNSDFFDTFMMVFFVLVYSCLLLIYRNIIDFCVLTFHSVTLIKLTDCNQSSICRVFQIFCTHSHNSLYSFSPYCIDYIVWFVCHLHYIFLIITSPIMTQGQNSGFYFWFNDLVG